MKEFTKTRAEDLYEHIYLCNNSSSMLLITNRALEDWYPLFSNPVIA
jgi:hypothetical protein